MKIHAKQIEAYIEFLKKAGFIITLHGAFVAQSPFMRYNYHQNPYCHYVKTVYGKWEECICRQDKVVAACADGSYFGCCYAGVGEFIYPVMGGGEVVSFVSVSGFFTDVSLDKSVHFAKKYGISEKDLTALLEKYLTRDIPGKSVVDAIIDPLVCMLEIYWEQKRETGGAEEDLYRKILRYVMENSHSKVTMERLSEQFHYSVSTISHLFLKRSGKSLPAYIDDLRLTEAKWYLSHSETGITEIAMFLGYSSSNYFSTVFKKKYHMTPREYRASTRENHVPQDGGAR